jgi:hypothetical protein
MCQKFRMIATAAALPDDIATLKAMVIASSAKHGCIIS